MSDEDVSKSRRPISVNLQLCPEANERLVALAKVHKRSKRLEALIRIYDSLNNVPEVTGEYSEIFTIK